MLEVGLFERCAFDGKWKTKVFIKNYKMINLLGEDGIVDVFVMVVVLADAGVDVAVLVVVVVSAKRYF